MEEKTLKKDLQKNGKVQRAQNGFPTIAVREFEPADKPEVQRIFFEGLMEMVPDTAFRSLRHHPESLLLYTALTVICFVITMCWWVIGLLPAIVLCGRYFYSRKVIHGYLEHALSRDMGDIEGFYMNSSDSCLWVAVLEGKVVGVVAAAGHQKSEGAVELKRMCVDRSFRQCGVGVALGRKVLEFAAAGGYSSVVLGTTAYTPAAHRLYQRLGFDCVSVTNGTAVHEARATMAVQYHASKLTNMETESSKIGYEKFFEDGSKLQYSVYALRNSPFRMATVCLSLLCFFLVAGVIGQAVHYQKVGQDHQTNFKALSKEKENLQEDLRTTQKGKRDIEATCNQLRQNYDYLSRKNNQIQTNNNLLTVEKTRLSESQSQLEEKNAALEKEKEQLKASQALLKNNIHVLTTAKEQLQGHYDSMIKRNSELQTNYDSVTNDRNNLQNKFNNMSRFKDQLQIQYNSLIKDVEDLEQRYNHSTNEKDKLETSHQNVTMAKDTLQANYNLLHERTNVLRVSYAAVVKEKEELNTRLQNATVERDLLKAQNNNLTAERDQLQVELERLNITMEAKMCPAGWQKFEFSCYFTSDTKKTWSQSREDCQAKGADLAIITSQKEMTFINSLYGSDKEVWIGLTDEGVEGQWKWIDGTAMTLAFWGKGQPNSYNGRDQDCVEFWHRASGNGEWNDESCTIQQNWICER